MPRASKEDWRISGMLCRKHRNDALRGPFMRNYGSQVYPLKESVTERIGHIGLVAFSIPPKQSTGEMIEKMSHPISYGIS